MVESLCKASLICGADGLLIETHYSPQDSLCDKEQTIDLETLKKILDFNKKLKNLNQD